jgi:hypothetical protein
MSLISAGFISLDSALKSGRVKNLIENLTPFSLFYEIHTETSSLRTLKIKPRNLNEIARS